MKTFKFTFTATREVLVEADGEPEARERAWIMAHQFSEFKDWEVLSVDVQESNEP